MNAEEVLIVVGSKASAPAAGNRKLGVKSAEDKPTMLLCKIRAFGLSRLFGNSTPAYYIWNLSGGSRRTQDGMVQAVSQARGESGRCIKVTTVSSGRAADRHTLRPLERSTDQLQFSSISPVLVDFCPKSMHPVLLML